MRGKDKWQQIKMVKLYFKYLCCKINMASLAKFLF